MTANKKYSYSLFSILFFVIIMLTVASASAQAVLFNNTNTGGVANGPKNPTVFNLQNRSVITQIYTYHWNNGYGAAPGTISIVNQSGASVGTFRASGSAGQGGVQNVNWTANLNLVLPAGVYSVVDSDQRSWSQNPQSNFAGFAVVRGSAVSAPPPAPPAAVPYGGNCRGAGCVHPDLRAYGGSGNCSATGGCGVQRSVHKVFLEQYFYAGKWDLGPNTSVAALAQVCTLRYNGSLVLIDDEPSYYYFIGQYAKFGCRR